MKTFILFCLFALGVQQASAYPIDPRPLRRLIIESEYVIIGRVLEVKTVARKKNEFSGGAIARLQILEVLQGKIKARIIEVSFNPNMICPAPPRYKAGTDIIAFLNRENRAFRTHALSYGVKTLSAEEISVYKDRILEMQKILKLEDEDQRFLETVEWLVKCAENEATRAEGTYELSPESDFMSYYARTETPPFKYMISPEQKARLKKALLTSDEEMYCDFGLVDLVYLGNEEEIHAYLLEGLKKISKEHIWNAEAYMARLMYKKTSPDLERLKEEFSDNWFKSDKIEELMNIVNNFVNLMEK